MVWQKIDDQFGVSKKVSRIPRKRRQQCVGLWLLALNAAGRYSSNGLLEASDLDEIDARATDVDELVRVDLWHRDGHVCPRCDQPEPGGIMIHDFLEYNPDSETIAAGRDSKREGGRHGNHVRWHVARRLIVAGCEWCESLSDRDAMGSAWEANPPGPVPGPVPLTDITNLPESSPEGDALARGLDQPNDLISARSKNAGISNLAEVRTGLLKVVGGPLSWSATVQIVEAICDRAQVKPVKKVDAYIATACRNSPDDVRWVYERLDLGVIA